MAIDLKVNGAQTDFPFFIFSLTNMNYIVARQQLLLHFPYCNLAPDFKLQ